ncbi:MAG TPA: hypothetical protein VLS48_03015, partial [Anaerolineales bacterium]|nr:hypothetical protein [Anaerolineales bacterium]
DGSKARQLFDMPATPLRITIARTFEWYDSMGEFDELYASRQDEEICQDCGRMRFQTWPARRDLLEEAELEEASARQNG